MSRLDRQREGGREGGRVVDCVYLQYVIISKRINLN